VAAVPPYTARINTTVRHSPGALSSPLRVEPVDDMGSFYN
jgi:hypothetical protein